MDINMDVCRECGVTAALVHALVKRDCENGLLLEGKKWCRTTITDMEREFPFRNRRTLERACSKLIKSGLMEVKVFEELGRWRRVCDR